MFLMRARAGFIEWAAVELPDPETPVGARGIGEPPVAAGCSAVLNAISAAVGDEVFVRAPVTLDHIVTALEMGRRTQARLTAERLSAEEGHTELD